MSESTSPSTGKKYGIARVCRVWDFSRSTFYGRKKRRNELMRSF